jgi:hypothetical protein
LRRLSHPKHLAVFRDPAEKGRRTPAATWGSPSTSVAMLSRRNEASMAASAAMLALKPELLPALSGSQGSGLSGPGTARQPFANPSPAAHWPDRSGSRRARPGRVLDGGVGHGRAGCADPDQPKRAAVESTASTATVPGCSGGPNTPVLVGPSAAHSAQRTWSDMPAIGQERAERSVAPEICSRNARETMRRTARGARRAARPPVARLPKQVGDATPGHT